MSEYSDASALSQASVTVTVHHPRAGRRCRLGMLASPMYFLGFTVSATMFALSWAPSEAESGIQSSPLRRVNTSEVSEYSSGPFQEVLASTAVSGPEYDVWIEGLRPIEYEGGPIYISATDTEPGKYTAFLRFDSHLFSRMLQSTSNHGSVLRLYNYSCSYRDAGDVPTITLHGISEPWSHESINALNLPARSKSYDSVTMDSGPGWVEWDVARLLDDWIEGAPIEGLALRIDSPFHLLASCDFGGHGGARPPAIRVYRDRAFLALPYLLASIDDADELTVLPAVRSK